MATTSRSDTQRDRATSRMAVLLRASDRKRLKQLAAQEKVSASEIVRRSIHSYQSVEDRTRQEKEDKIVRAALNLLEESMGGRNESTASTLAKFDQLQEELQELELQ